MKGPWDLDHKEEDFLYDKVLLEFPIFSLNDDYIRAITNIVFSKIDQAQNMINHKNEEIEQLRSIVQKDRTTIQNDLKLLKSKMKPD